MAKSFSDLQVNTRVYLDEVTQADWRDTEVQREVNAKYMELYSAVVSVYEDYYSTKSTADSVANQQEYALPSDIYKIRRVEIKYNPSDANDKFRRAKPVSMDQFSADLGNSSLGPTIYRNPAYYVRGNIIGFVPTPTESGDENIVLWYIKQVSELSSSSDVIDIPFPDRYAQLIPLGAAGVLLRKGQQEEIVASKYLQDFADGIEKMKEELEDRIADDIKMIVDTEAMNLDMGTSYW